MKKTLKRAFFLLFVICIFLSNLIPIFGPVITSSAMGYNEKRFRRFYRISRKLQIISILLGNLFFSLFFLLLISYSVEFKSLILFWLVVTIFLLNCIFSIIFYFIGKNRENKPFLDKLKF